MLDILKGEDMKKVLLILLFLMQGCATITYYYPSGQIKNENIKKQYITPKNNKTYLLDTEVKNTYYLYITPKNNKTYLLDTEVKNTYYLNNGEIRYKGRFLGSGRKMLDRIIEIEKELRGKE